MNRPKEWKEVEIREIAKCTGGVSFALELQGRDTGDIPFYKVSDMNDAGNHLFMDSARNYISQEDLKKLNGRLHKARSIVFPKVGGALLTNKKRMLSCDAMVDNNIMAVSLHENAPCIPEYLYLYFESVNLRDLSNPGPLPSINAARVYEQIISLPTLPEQRKIAAVLLRIQKAIELQEAIIERTRELKKAAMQFVFTRGLRGEKTKETEIGTMPESWEVVRVGDSLEKIRFDRDKQIPASEYEASGKHRIVDQGQSLVSGYTDDGSSLIKENLPLIVFGDHTRALKLVDFPFALGGDGTKLLKPVSGFDCQFFFFALTAIDIPSRGYNRHFPLLSSSYIPRPKENEQIEIARVFSVLNQKIEIYSAKKSALQDLFKTTLNKLMSGEIRVKDFRVDDKETAINGGTEHD